MRTQNSIKLSLRLNQNRYGIYGFRLVIPKKYRVLFNQYEYRVSLKTRDKDLAKSRAFELTGLVNHHFKKICMALNPTDEYNAALELVQSLQLQDFSAHVSFLENLSENASKEDKSYVTRLINIRRHDEEIKELIFNLFDEFAKNLSNANESQIDSITCDFYAQVSPLKIKQTELSNELNNLTLEMQALMYARVNDINLQSAKEEFDSDKEKLAQFTSDMIAKVAASSPNIDLRGTPSFTQENAPCALLSDVVKEYCINQKAEGKWTAKTEDTVNEIFTLWLRIVGDITFNEYGFEQHRLYKSVIQRLPPNINKSPKFKNKSIEDIVKMNEAPAAAHTINKKLLRISSLFEWAIKYGYTNINPAKGMVIKNPKLARDERQVFSEDDLSKLFNSEIFTRRKYKYPYYFWLPLLGFYTGARLNELCQLHLNDFDVIDGVDVLKINCDMPDKRLKTKAAVRDIPIHSALIKFGLLDYVNKLRKQKNVRLFPELKVGRDGYGQAASKWFARFREKCGVIDDGKVFHSFRHTFINQLKQSDISKEKIAVLVGHEDESETFGRYGKNFNIKILTEAIEAIKLNITEILPADKKTIIRD
jgi:integrase